MSTEFILGLILAIPLGILTNFASPWVKSFFDKSSLSIRERRLHLLLKRYKLVKDLTKNQTMLFYMAFRPIYSGILLLSVLIITVVMLVLFSLDSTDIGSGNTFLSVFSYLIAFISGLGIYKMDYFFTIVTDAIKFENFKKKVIKKYEKLGGNPEDLDKEESELESNPVSGG